MKEHLNNVLTELEEAFRKDNLLTDEQVYGLLKIAQEGFRKGYNYGVMDSATAASDALESVQSMVCGAATKSAVEETGYVNEDVVLGLWAGCERAKTAIGLALAEVINTKDHVH